MYRRLFRLGALVAVAAGLLAVVAGPAAAAEKSLSFDETPSGWVVTSGEQKRNVGRVSASSPDVNASSVRYTVSGADGFVVAKRSGRVHYTGAELSSESVTLTFTAHAGRKVESATMLVVVTVSGVEVKGVPQLQGVGIGAGDPSGLQPDADSDDAQGSGGDGSNDVPQEVQQDTSVPQSNSIVSRGPVVETVSVETYKSHPSGLRCNYFGQVSNFHPTSGAAGGDAGMAGLWANGVIMLGDVTFTTTRYSQVVHYDDGSRETLPDVQEAKVSRTHKSAACVAMATLPKYQWNSSSSSYELKLDNGICKGTVYWDMNGPVNGRANEMRGSHDCYDANLNKLFQGPSIESDLNKQRTDSKTAKQRVGECLSPIAKNAYSSCKQVQYYSKNLTSGKMERVYHTKQQVGNWNGNYAPTFDSLY